MKDELTKLGWMETRTQEVGQYHCVRCEEIFQFASDNGGIELPPNFCPICGRQNPSKKHGLSPEFPRNSGVSVSYP